MSDETAVCVALGVILLVVGFIAYNYPQRYGWQNPFTDEWTYTHSTYPHRDLGMLLMALGVVSIIAGVVIGSMKRPQVKRIEKNIDLLSFLKRPKNVDSLPLLKCPKCGIHYRGHDYCPVCRVKLKLYTE